jgi:signal transduction histidine kinase
MVESAWAFSVKAFTEMPGGIVAVKSELDKGSTFTLTLPVEIGRTL